MDTISMDKVQEIMRSDFDTFVKVGEHDICGRAFHPYYGLLVDVWDYENGTSRRVALESICNVPAGEMLTKEENYKLQRTIQGDRHYYW